MNEWRGQDARQSTLGSRIYTQIVKLHAQNELEELQPPDQGDERRGNEDAVLKGITVSHSILLWGETRILKGGLPSVQSGQMVAPSRSRVQIIANAESRAGEVSVLEAPAILATPLSASFD